MHVAFRVERAFCQELAAALVDPGQQPETLARWWERRETRLDTLLTRERPSRPKVRLAALHAVQRLAPRLPALEAIRAPATVIEFQRRLLQQALDEMDPTHPRVHTPVPEITEPWVFVDRMLAAAHAGLPSLSLREHRGGPGLSTCLPRSFEGAHAESSGPITYALAGDRPGPRLDHRLAGHVRRLRGTGGLISFVWIADDSAGDWDPLRV